MAATPATAASDAVGAGTTPDWKRIQKIVGGISGEWTDDGYAGAYSDKMPDTALLGNGDVGVTSAGAAGQKTFLVSKSDFISAGDLKGVFNSGDNLTKPLPIGGITIQERSTAGTGNLAPTAPGQTVTTHEVQDILDARINTTMSIGGVPLAMKTWLAPDKNVLVTEVTSQGKSPVDLEVKTWGKKGSTNYPVASAIEQGVATASRFTYNNAPSNPASWRSQATLATGVVGAETTASADAAAGGALTDFTLEPRTTVQIVTAIGGGGKTYAADGSLQTADPVAEAVGMLAKADDADLLRELENEHGRWWKDFWSASYIDLPNRPEAMRYYYGAQYLLGSTSRAGKPAPGLYGIWHTTDNPSWSSDYHLNYNFIATFFGTNSSNRPKLSLPAGEGVLAFAEEGGRRAADPAQLRRMNASYVDSRPNLQGGINDALLYPVGIGPWGTVTDDNYLSEALNAAFSAYPLIQYYHYTQDRQYLEQKVYGYLKRCVNFYDAWLDKSGETYTLYAGYNEDSWATNPAVELAALKNVLTELIDASVTLDLDADQRAHWQDVLDHLAPQPTSTWKEKQVYSLAEKEWKNGQWLPLANPVPADGNIIPLDIVVPGGQLGYYSPNKDQQIARNTIDVFGSDAWKQINNFPRIFNDAVQSRYPADAVLARLTETINAQIKPNLRISDRTHGVEKIGATAAMNNMLLMSDQGVVKVFPNWVAGEDASFSRLRAEGAFVVSAAYDGDSNRIGDVTVTSEAGKRLTIAAPWKEGADVFDSTGAEVETTLGTAPNWSTEKTVTFDTQKGETYTLRPHYGVTP
ncbi:glycosyl hydrolase family 95 catalytic domain-containing protein [Nonomuraea sp. NPDC050536]|uniref:glycosyl hydrolase family 95 catalytic domain-containing protein n=1 Tax=Nonomuraea sp. NPDC050536 TaxID=3364366 RepID=UPI0037C98C4D